jgi:uncharacterized repeat protein (TIGR01451 family)
LGVLAVSGVALLATAGQAADPAVSASATDAPDPVTAGLTASYTFALANDATATLTHTTFSASLPAGSTYVSASPSAGTCTQASGTVTCDIGSLQSGADASVTVELTAPASAFSMCGSFAFKEGTTEQPDPSHLDTVAACAATDVRPAGDPNFRGGCIDAGATLATGNAATSSDRQNTAVTVEEDACVSVSEVAATSPTEACGAGFTCTTEISDVILPTCSPADPCTVTLTFDKDLGKVRRIFKDGVLVAPCTSPAIASPDPCVVSKTQLKGGDTRFVLNFAVDARLRGG